MAINAFPIATVPPSANLIANTPSGSVTATDVQTAINQLSSLIPSPGPGTDPLFLTQGLNVSTVNPTINPDTSNRYAAIFNMITDSSTEEALFGNQSTLQANYNAPNGQANYSTLTQVKETFFALACSGICNGSGQKFLYSSTLVAYGMSDSAAWGNISVSFAGGAVAGDEGQGWSLVNALTQQDFLQKTTISSIPAKSLINTTTTQTVTKSMSAQTVTVASTAGAIVGDWVVVGQEIPAGLYNIEPVQVISFSPTSITGIFRCNHANGTTITPALRLICPSTFQMGQDRVLVNMSGASYSTGLVTGVSGGGLIGTATGWANNMVGGNALNIGALSMQADDHTDPPFDAGANRLKSWFQITAVTDATHLGIHSFSVAGSTAYFGKGPGGGTYIVRPAARVLRIISLPLTGEIICETSTHTWTVGDEVQCVTCPYPDVTGFQYHMSTYTNGGIYRSFMNIVNVGARTFDNCFQIGNWGTLHLPDGDDIAFNTVLQVNEKCNVGLDLRSCQTAAMVLSVFDGGNQTDAGGTIGWGPNITAGASLGPNSTNAGLSLKTMLSGATTIGTLDFIAASHGVNTNANAVEMLWTGYISLPVTPFDHGSILIDNVTHSTDYERAFWRWTSNVAEIGTEKGGAGTLRDIVLKTGTVEQIRCMAGSNVKFSNPASFSANGAVATVLGSLGPVGSSTTVQKWLTIKDDGGTTRYIPCF